MRITVHSFPVPLVRAAALLAAMVLAGCSALQIDVDVYKGPLVNEQEIQLRQFAALAIAAKPVLASVRNELEDAARLSKNMPALAPRLDDDYVDRSDFQSGLARFINGSMSYYGDLGSPQLRRLLQAETRALDGLKKLDYAPDDIGLADEVAAAASARGKADPVLARFANQYHLLLCGAPTEGKCAAVDNASKVNGKGRDTEQFAAVCIEVRNKPVDFRCPATPRSNSLFMLLSEDSVVQAHARLLFGDGQHAAFVARIVQMSRGFLQAREGMQDLFIAALDAAEATAVRSGTNEDAAADELRTALPEVLAYATQTRTLACMLTIDGAARVQAAWTSLPEDARRILDASPVRGAARSAWTESDYLRADTALAAAARARPAEMALFLRVVHRETIGQPQAEVQTCRALVGTDKEHVTYLDARIYGLASGPTMASSFDSLFQRLEASLVPVRRAANAGFDRGRTPLGIEHATQQFLEALEAHKHEVNDPDVRAAQQSLEETLIFFAERMLFVVNTVTPSAIESDVGVQAPATTYAAGERADSPYTKQGAQDELVGRLQSRIAVLQSLGNSIILQANDLHRQLKHEQRQSDRLAGEVEATRRALNPGAPMVFDALMMEAKAQLKKKTDAASGAAAAATNVQQASEQAALNASAAQAALKQANDALAARSAAYKPLEMLVRTLISSAERGNVYKASTPTDASEAADQVALLAALKAAYDGKGDVKLDDYLGTVNGWMKLTASGLGGNGPRHERLTAALSYLDDAQSPLRASGLADATRDRLDASVHALLLAWAGDQQGQLRVLAADRDKAQKQADQAGKQATVAAAAKAKTQAAVSPQQTAQRQATVVVSVLADRRDDVLRAADRGNAGDAASVLALLRSSVAAVSPATDDTRLTLSFLAGFQLPPVASYALPADWKGKTAVDVYDQLIAQLRQARIQAELAGLKEQSTHALNAINLAYEARAGVAFLRPASDYLRSVYSSNNLQDVADPAHENLLDAWWKRLLQNQKENEYERESRKETEKRSWQNINRVSLAGGGTTNYVVAKDDIGNWYVKAYSANPEPIIKSAQSLALFSSGRALNVNLLGRVDLQRQLAATSDPDQRAKLHAEFDQPATQTDGSLVKVHDRYTAQYGTSLSQTADSLKQVVQSLPGGLQDAAMAATTGTSAVLDPQFNAAVTDALSETTAAQTVLGNALLLPATDASRLGKIEDALYQTFDALRRYRQTMFARITPTAAKLCTGDPTGCSKAANAAQGLVRDKVSPVLAQHRAAISAYDNALFNLEDIATSK